MKPADTNDLVYPQALFTGYIVHHKMAWDNFNNSFQIKLILETQNRDLSHIAKKNFNYSEILSCQFAKGFLLQRTND